MDCLKKLAQRLPEYQRVLEVIISIVEAGLYSTPHNIISLRSARRESNFQNASTNDDTRFHFEEYQLLYQQQEQEKKTRELVAGKHSDEDNPSIKQRMLQLLEQMGDESPLEKEALFMAFLQTNMDLLASLAAGEVLPYFINHPNPERINFFYSLLMLQLKESCDIERLLQEVRNHHLSRLKDFLHTHEHTMEMILFDTASKSGNTDLQVFQRLIDRFHAEFAAVLWRSPYLTAQIFQVCLYSVAQVL